MAVLLGKEQVEHGKQIAWGVDNHLIPIAHLVLNKGLSNITPDDLQFVRDRLDELVPGTREHYASYPLIVGGGSDVEQIQDRAKAEDWQIRFWLLMQLLTVIVQESNFESELSGVSSVMIIGEQGVGKDAVTPVFEEYGYTTVGMSSTVRDLTSAWLLDRSQTIDKIVVGQVYKELHGDGSLVPISLLQAIRQGHDRVVVIGPRLPGEADTAVRYGASLIGIVAHANPDIDQQIRRQRIVLRAKQDPSRLSDIANFDQREVIEHNFIQHMLRRSDCQIIVNNFDDLQSWQDYLRVVLPGMINLE